jgi:hypothetical protein
MHAASRARTERKNTMKRPLILALAAGATLLAAGAAQAHGNVQWSVGISLPPVATVIGNGPGFYAAPVYEPAPVRYLPPVVYRAPPVVYEAPPVVVRAPRPYYVPASVFFERGRWVPPGHRHEWRDWRWNDRDGRDGHRRHHD